MMQSSIGLPGLERLIAVCRAQGIRIEQRPPLGLEFHLKDTLLGQPIDPMVREQFARFNIRCFGDDLFLLPPDGVESFNQQRRTVPDELYESVFIYASFGGLPYDLATVPALADNRGVQPVVFLILDMEREVMPIASSVDRAFGLYARYLDDLATRYGSVEAGDRALGTCFPRSVPHLVAEDRQLVEMLEAHRFDGFISIDPNLPEWSTSVLRAAHGRV